MIRQGCIEDIESINFLLKQFNYSINKENFTNPFFKVCIYEENSIVGVIIYSLLYDRIEIEYIAVDELCKNNGVGTKLLKKIETLNVKNITLEELKNI